jgi:hypothetical protein
MSEVPEPQPDPESKAMALMILGLGSGTTPVLTLALIAERGFGQSVLVSSAIAAAATIAIVQLLQRLGRATSPFWGFFQLGAFLAVVIARRD